MKLDRRDGTQQRNVLIGMITNDAVCGAVTAKWPKPEGLFDSRWSNLVGNWSTDYYRKYRRAPGKQVAQIFDAWASAGKKDGEVVKLVEQFLAGLSGQYVKLGKGVQADYLIDVAGGYFTEVQLRKAHAGAAAALEAGQPEKAAELMAGAKKIDLAGGAGFDLLEDKEVLKRAFLKQSEPPLIKYPGAAGVFLGRIFSRDCLVAIEGSEKKGKTAWLLDISWRAMLAGHKVAFFEIGDLSEGQIRMRFALRAAKRPFDAEPYQYPISLEPPGQEGKSAYAVMKEGKCSAPLTYKEVSKIDNRLREKLKAKYDNKVPLFKGYTCPARGVSVTGINAVLNVWEAQNDWRPDVVIIDYADILAPEAGVAETRDQINQSWILMRAMSSKRHCLVVTATQTNAKSYDAELLDMDNFSEDKRKRSHVTAVVGLNQRDDEKEMGVYRLNCYAVREQKFDKRKVVYVAGSLAIANPVMFSTF